MTTLHESEKARIEREQPTVTVIRQYELQCAHRLTAGVPDNHKCRRPHGHRYVVRVAVSGAVDPATGMVIEYGVLDRILAPLLVVPLDHHDLNTLSERLSGPLADAVAANPTVENLAVMLWHHSVNIAATMRNGIATRLEWIEIEEDSRAAVRIGRSC